MREEFKTVDIAGHIISIMRFPTGFWVLANTQNSRRIPIPYRYPNPLEAKIKALELSMNNIDAIVYRFGFGYYITINGIL